MGASTIVALSSGQLPSAIAVLRLSGPASHAAARRLCTLPEAGQAALRTIRDPDDNSLVDEGLVLRFDAPRSATGEDAVEFHLHGSRAVVDRVIQLLLGHAEVRLAESGEFTRRALAAGKMDLIEAEALSDLLAAETEEQRQQAMAQMQGGLSAAIHHLLDRIIDLSAQVEAAIDYVGDEDEMDRADDVFAGLDALRDAIKKLLDAPARRPLHDGVRVVFAGPPNSGKSRLFNKIVGFDRAIVHSEAGTTRDSIDHPIRLDGRAFVFVDTAGQRETAGDAIEAEGIDRSRAAMESADLLVWFGDPDRVPNNPNVILVSPKSDLGTVGQGIPVSSQTTDGAKELVAELQRRANLLLPKPGEVVLNMRHREALDAVMLDLQTPLNDDLAILGSALSSARRRIEALLGIGTLDDVLDRVFSRFCLGK